MTYLYTETPQFFSDICEEIRLFIDTRKIDRLEKDEVSNDGFVVLHCFSEIDNRFESTSRLYSDGKNVSEYTYRCDTDEGKLARKRAAKRAVKISVYRAMVGYFRTKMPWGSLTGIRPTKLLRDSQTRMGEDGAESLFLNEFDVSQDKYDFAKEIVEIQAPYLPKSSNDIDVYIGIPFCVTRCAYCSFASSTPDVFKNAENLYVDALLYELSMAEELFKGKNIRALYVGGGTPTAINDENLEKILKRAAEIGKNALEFTVEAGRPDTITPRKLEIIKSYGARRISVNAQTLRDDTLQRIGRAHTAEEFFKAYDMTAAMGFDAINVDIIAGLPGETQADVMNTIKQIIVLEPDNITVHTLAVKRASAFAAANMGAFPTSGETATMLRTAQELLEHAEYRAYYMYRQKYMKGSMENAGFAKKGKQCLYNIDNMEEVCDVAAFGAGAISKRIFDVESRIERAANIKDLREYIARHKEMPQRKYKLFNT